MKENENMKRKCTKCGGLTDRPVEEDENVEEPEKIDSKIEDPGNFGGKDIHDGPFSFYDFSDASRNRIYTNAHNVGVGGPYNGQQIVQILNLLPEMRVQVVNISGSIFTLRIPEHLIAPAHTQDLAITSGHYAIVKIENGEDSGELISVVHPKDRLHYIGKGTWPLKLPNNYYF